MKPEEMKDASFENRNDIEDDTPCGCYFCMEVFKGSDIEEWVEDGTTALCPTCGIDTVVANAIDVEALGKGCEHWFTGTVYE